MEIYYSSQYWTCRYSIMHSEIFFKMKLTRNHIERLLMMKLNLTRTSILLLPNWNYNSYSENMDQSSWFLAISNKWLSSSHQLKTKLQLFSLLYLSLIPQLMCNLYDLLRMRLSEFLGEKLLLAALCSNSWTLPSFKDRESIHTRVDITVIELLNLYQTNSRSIGLKNIHYNNRRFSKNSRELMLP